MFNLWLVVAVAFLPLSSGFLNVKPVRGKDGKTYLPFYASGYPYSNHYITDITIDGNVFKSTEQYYFYRKAQIFGDKQAEAQLLTETDPMKAKAIGRAVKNFDQQKWDEVSYTIMKRAIFEKFKQHRSLKDALLKTNGILVEAAPNDNRWGVGLSQNDPRITDPSQWKGTNLLGKALMEVRTGLKNNADKRSPDIGNRKTGSNGKTYSIFYSIRNMMHAFYPAEVLYINGLNFQSVQHFFAYTKAMTFGDSQLAKKIREEPSGRQAQLMSFKLKSFDKQKWDGMSYDVMVEGLTAKFTQNEYLKRALKATGTDDIIFADVSNVVWGSGLDASSPGITDPGKWKGQNLLGKALEEVRDTI